MGPCICILIFPEGRWVLCYESDYWRMTENYVEFSQDNFRLTGNLEFQILPELKLLTQYTYQRRKGEESSYASSNTQEGSGYWGDQKGVGRWAYSARANHGVRRPVDLQQDF